MDVQTESPDLKSELTPEDVTEYGDRIATAVLERRALVATKKLQSQVWREELNELDVEIESLSTCLKSGTKL